MKRATLLATILALLSGLSSHAPAMGGNVPSGYPATFMMGYVFEAHIDAAGRYVGAGSEFNTIDHYMAPIGAGWGATYRYLIGGTRVDNGPNCWWNAWPGSGGMPAAFMNLANSRSYMPVFIYENLQAFGGNCASCIKNAFDNASFMGKYFSDWADLMIKIDLWLTANPTKVVTIDVEPDVWGYMQQNYNNNPALITAQVAGATNPGGAYPWSSLAAFPNTVQGAARAMLYLKDQRVAAGNRARLKLAYHVSSWAVAPNPATQQGAVNIATHASTVAGFVNACKATSGSDWDLLFLDPADGDAGLYSTNGLDPAGTTHWWDKANVTEPTFNRYRDWVNNLSNNTSLRAMLWQVPIGNQVYKTMSNTHGHYQDTRAEYFLNATDGLAHVCDWAANGVIGILWGRGSIVPVGPAYTVGTGGPDYWYITWGTDYSGGTQDNITNAGPTGINATVADDDGGYLRSRMPSYFAAPCVIPVAGTPTFTPTRTRTPTLSPSRTPTPTATPSRTPSASTTPSATRTATRSSTGTSTQTVAATSTFTPTFTRTPTGTPSRTVTASTTPTATRSGTRTSTATSTQTVAVTPTFTPTATPSHTPSSTRTRTATGTASRTPTGTSTQTVAVTPTFTSTGTPSRTSTSTFTPTATRTATGTSTAAFTGTSTGTVTPGSSPTFTQTATPTRTSTVSSTPSSSSTPAPTGTATSTGTSSRTVTPGSSPTYTQTATPTRTVTVSATPSSSSTAAATATATSTGTSSRTITPGSSPSFTPTATVTRTATVSATPSSSSTAAASATATSTGTSSRTITPGSSPSFTPTSTVTRTATASATPSSSSTAAASATPSATETSSPTPSHTATTTPSPGMSPFFAVIVSSLDVVWGPVAGGTTVTITGMFFTVGSGIASVTFGGKTVRGFTVVNDTTLVAVTDSHDAGLVDVTVVPASSSGSAGTLPQAFEYREPGDANGSLEVKDAVAMPNPAAGGSVQVMAYLRGPADELRFTVYSEAMVKVRRNAAPGAYQAGWNGCALDMSGLGNGMWYVVVEAGRKGSLSRHRIVKLVILR